MDPSNDCATPKSDGRGSSSSGSDGNGGRSSDTSSRRRRRMPSSPTGTQLMSEFNAAADAGGSGSSSSPSSPGALDLEGVLLLATPVATDSTIIMEGELLDDDNEPGTPSGTRPSASLVDNNGLDTSSSARRSTSVDNNGPSNRVSISDLDLVLVSSGSQGSSGGGSGGRRNASNDRFPQREGPHRMYAPSRNNRYYEAGSSSRQPAPGQRQGVGPPNIQIQPQQGPEFPYSFNFHPPPGFRIPPNMNFQLPVPQPTPQPWVGPGFGAGLVRVQPGLPVQGTVNLYGSPALYPPLPGVTTMVIPRRSSGLYPPPGVTIRHPPTSSGDPPPLPEQPAGSRVTITAPPASEGPRQAEATPPEQTVPSRVTIKAPPAGEGSSSSPPKQPEQPETRPSQPVPLARVPTSFRWPPNAELDALITDWLHGPSRRTRRLPVFEDICPGDEPSQPPPPTSEPPPPPPPPPPPSQPPPPPPTSQPPPTPPPPPPPPTSQPPPPPPTSQPPPPPPPPPRHPPPSPPPPPPESP